MLLLMLALQASRRLLALSVSQTCACMRRCAYYIAWQRYAWFLLKHQGGHGHFHVQAAAGDSVGIWIVRHPVNDASMLAVALTVHGRNNKCKAMLAAAAAAAAGDGCQCSCNARYILWFYSASMLAVAVCMWMVSKSI
jgi:hypothetical protein